MWTVQHIDWETVETVQDIIVHTGWELNNIEPLMFSVEFQERYTTEPSLYHPRAKRVYSCVRSFQTSISLFFSFILWFSRFLYHILLENCFQIMPAPRERTHKTKSNQNKKQSIWATQKNTSKASSEMHIYYNMYVLVCFIHIYGFISGFFFINICVQFHLYAMRLLVQFETCN